MRILAVLVLAAATVLSAAAGAEPVDALFQQFGLIGTWAPDCKRPASPVNPHVSTVTPGPGLVLESQDLGPDYTINRYSMLTAERVSPDELSVQAIFQPGTEAEERQKLVFLVRKDSRRTIFNQADGGAVRVKDGVVTAFATKTSVLEKCE
jgi:hypothetical protein